MRIAALTPAGTEVAFALGLGERVVAVSHDSDWPADVTHARVVTRQARDFSRATARRIRRAESAAIASGTSLVRLDEGALRAIRPDVVIAGGSGSARTVSAARVAEALGADASRASILALDPVSLEGILNGIVTIGALTSHERAAVRLVERLRSRLARLERKVHRRRERGHGPPRVVTIEWLDPLVASGGWVPEQVRRAGAWELVGREGEPPAETSYRAIRELDPEIIVLMPRGHRASDAAAEYSRLKKPLYWKRIEAVRRGNVFAVDADAYYLRPGPRVIEGIEMLAEIFDPDGFVEIAPMGAWTPIFP